MFGSGFIHRRNALWRIFVLEFVLTLISLVILVYLWLSCFAAAVCVSATISLLFISLRILTFKTRWNKRYIQWPAAIILFELFTHFILCPVVQYDPELFWINFPTIGGQVNRDHLRGPSVQQGDKNHFRILALGDSATYGFGGFDGNSYPRQLEKMLRVRFPGRKIQVLNAGVPGYSSFQGLVYLARHGWDWQPKIVTAMFGANDGSNSGFHLEDKDRVPVALSRWRICLLKTPSVIAQFYLHFSARWNGYSKPTFMMRVSPEDFLENLKAIKSQCDLHGSALILLTYPVRDEASPIEEYNKVCREYASETGLPLVDAAKGLRAIGGDAFMGDNHPSGLGRKKIGEWIAGTETVKNIF